MINIKVINKSKYDLPEYKRDGDSGMDVKANIEEKIILKPLERVLIPTGLYFELCKGFELQVRPRSGTTLKKGLSVLNSPGTIDSNYRGELGIIAINLSNNEVEIEPGERIAQIVCTRVEEIKLIDSNKIDTNTKRGEDGYGSTGIF